MGAVARFAVIKLINDRVGISFPAGTWAVNITGSFLLGFLMSMGLNHADQIGYDLKLALTTGFLGSYTTFSAFSYETCQLIRGGKFLTALSYVAASVGCGLGAAWSGMAAFKHLLR